MGKGKWVQMSEDDFKRWLEKLPAEVRAVAEKYPPGVYKMKEGAPYDLCCAGTIVHFYSYHRNGTMSMVVPAANKLPEALKWETEHAIRHGHNAKRRREIHAADILVEVDPIWMEKIDMVPDISDNETQ